MEPFSITCTTCKSKLKVRDERVIGQIQSCPKCNGMVLVKLPENGHPEAKIYSQQTAPVAQPAPVRPRQPQDTLAGSKNFDDIDALLAGAPRVLPASPAPAPVHTPASAPSSGAKPAKPVAAQQPDSRPPLASAPPPPGNDHPVPPLGESQSPAEALNQPTLPSSDWAAQRPWKYALMLAASIITGLVLTTALVAVGRAWFRGSEQLAALPDPPAGDSVPAAPNDPAPETTTQPHSVEKPAKDDPDAAKTTTPAKTPGPDPPVALPPEKSVPPASIPPVAKLPPDKDPLEIAPAPKPAESPGKEAGDPLNKIASILDGAMESLAPEKTSPAPEAKPAEERPVDSPPARPSLPRPSPRKVDVAKRLADPLPAVQVEGIPLADFLRLISDMSTIPITLEPDALPFRGQSAESPITLDLANTTVGAALEAAIAAHHLESAATDDQQLTVRPPERLKGELLKRDAAIKDLTGGDKDKAAQLAEWMTALVDPDSWGDADVDKGAWLAAGPDKLMIQNRFSVHTQLLLLEGKLRIARNVPLDAKFAKFDPALFSLPTRSQRAAEKLATPVTLNFSRSTPLVKILDRLAIASKVRFLVDWRSLAELEWNPDGEATLSVDKQSLSVALKNLLDPMQLTYRAINERTFQILTPAAVLRRPEIELFPVGDLVNSPEAAERLLSRLRAELGDANFHGRGGAGELRFDAVSKHLLAALPQPAQQEAARLLDEWRAEKKPRP